MMNFKKIIISLFAMATLFSVSACGDGESLSRNDSDNVYSGEGSEKEESSEAKSEESVDVSFENGYEQISGETAKQLMETESDYVIIDARTKEEFAEGHIEGAILIPEYEIHNRAEDELQDKSQLILVYCRSGRRSKIAAEALSELGYTNVKEFGGIIDWKYEIVK